MGLDGKIPTLNLKIQLDCQLIKKIDKKVSIGKTIRKKLFLDESRVRCFAVDKMERKQFRDYLFGYFFHTDVIEPYFRINLRNTSKDLTGLTNLEKDQYMKFFDNSDITSECFLCHRNANSHLCTFLQLIHGNQTNIFRTRAAYIFVQNFIMKMQMVLFKNILFTQTKK